MQFLVFALLLVFSTKSYSRDISTYQDCLKAAYQYQAKGKDINPEIWCGDVGSAAEESCREAGLSAKLRGENRDVNVKASCRGLIDRDRDYNVIYSNCLNAAYRYQAHDSYMNPEQWCADVNSAEEESCREAGLSAKFRGENRDVNVKESCKR